jgi:two-component system LytT family response regulator
MSALKAVIVDDSAQARKLLKLMLQEITDAVIVVGEAEDGESGYQLIQEEQPEVLFLDIEMPGKSGIQLAEQLYSSGHKLQIVFTTAYNEYAVSAFRLAAVDYLLKPIQEAHLSEAVSKTLENSQRRGVDERLQSFVTNIKSEEPTFITVPVFNGFENIELSRLTYIEADGSYTHVYIDGKKYLTLSKNLKYFESILEQHKNFIRAHRSYLVNLNHVIRFDRKGRGTLVLNNGVELDVARDRRDDIISRIKSE